MLVVDCAEEEQVRRLMARDGEDRESAFTMLATQASREERLDAAHDVIDNSGTADDLPAQVAASTANTVIWPQVPETCSPQRGGRHRREVYAHASPAAE